MQETWKRIFPPTASIERESSWTDAAHPLIRASRPFRLCGFSVVRSYNPAESSITSDMAFELRHEGLIEYFAIHTDSAMRPLGVIVVDPDAIDVVELLSTETDEVIQALALERPR